jgi:hypothetical protein
VGVVCVVCCGVCGVVCVVCCGVLFVQFITAATSGYSVYERYSATRHSATAPQRHSASVERVERVGAQAAQQRRLSRCMSS